MIRLKRNIARLLSAGFEVSDSDIAAITLYKAETVTHIANIKSDREMHFHSNTDVRKIQSHTGAHSATALQAHENESSPECIVYLLDAASIDSVTHDGMSAVESALQHLSAVTKLPELAHLDVYVFL